MSFHSYRVVFCAPIPMGSRTPDFGSCSMSYTFKLHGEGIRESQALSITLQDVHLMNLSYMVLLDMWNMFGYKFLSFIGGKSVGRVQQRHLLIINR